MARKPTISNEEKRREKKERRSSVFRSKDLDLLTGCENKSVFEMRNNRFAYLDQRVLKNQSVDLSVNSLFKFIADIMAFFKQLNL